MLSHLSHKIINHCHMIQKYYNLVDKDMKPVNIHVNVSIRVTYLPLLVITYLPQNGQSTLEHTSTEPNPFYLFVLSIPDAVWMKARTFFLPGVL